MEVQFWVHTLYLLLTLDLGIRPSNSKIEIEIVIDTCNEIKSFQVKAQCRLVSTRVCTMRKKLATRSNVGQSKGKVEGSEKRKNTEGSSRVQGLLFVEKLWAVRKKELLRQSPLQWESLTCRIRWITFGNRWWRMLAGFWRASKNFRALSSLLLDSKSKASHWHPIPHTIRWQRFRIRSTLLLLIWFRATKRGEL